ncbi:tRNA (adenosine(37)-N6)-threonylcarbamoyltransferase complex ATPase subunit type 1 TsaE [Ornithinimicrobium sp. F0845]|uniref:tRNA (adenosine(37)-N6)-threonylcarbamoyltransferase complex ATPase subunit type 1 TsaE n=1 Tax=Ornithinimicrobium sp. F0845 TaxID=2926412 RepID=UPI001FF5931D|nr:tRNA (adenosine(37)-N6)-threonylcarbamoyltransferase complex ATPase subunit type 1 TsaE [Ornithinimicrobium sp. F0845]MCK0112300.1 tRNA (adenosine(37)-N6)-threonylcarbamoyltransferase complex ATPase subunit type 1 TsaE [Ornithinimicrobium sp. F0845]
MLATALRGGVVELATAADTHALGVELGRGLGAGDLVLLTGDLAAGKTTLTQGIGAGLGVRGPITSPTFVIARVHPSLGSGPDLVHVDAYRLGGVGELDDLDLDADLEAVVTVVEWGHGMAEALAEDWLEIVLTRREEGRTDTIEGDEPRWARVLGHGPRWAGED